MRETRAVEDGDYRAVKGGLWCRRCGALVTLDGREGHDHAHAVLALPVIARPAPDATH